METTKMQHHFSAPMISGAAERVVTLSAAAANRRMTTGVNNDDTYSNSSSLRDLSISEILKLADDRARLTGINRRSTDNPWHKRMAVSDNITRRQTPTSSLTNHQQIGLNTAKGKLDSNEEFFKNLMTKMTMEQFMPCDQDSRLRKRTCLWNKENSSTCNTIKRHKERRINTKLIPATTELYTRRLLPQQNNNDSPAGVKVQSPCEAMNKRQQDRAIPQYTATVDPIQVDINMKECPSCFTDCNSSSLATTISINQSFYENQTVHDCISTCTEETLKLEHNSLIQRIEHDTINETSSCHYYTKKCSKNFSDSPRLLTIEENRELFVAVKSPILDALDTGFDISIQLTPPLPKEPVDCEACNFAEEDYEDNINYNSGQISSPMLLDDQDREIPGILDKSLFT